MRVRNVGQDFPEKEKERAERLKGEGRGCGIVHKASLKRRHKDGEGRKEMPIDLPQRRYFHGASWIFIKRWFVLYCRYPCSPSSILPDSLFDRFSPFLSFFPSFVIRNNPSRSFFSQPLDEFILFEVAFSLLRATIVDFSPRHFPPHVSRCVIIRVPPQSNASSSKRGGQFSKQRNQGIAQRCKRWTSASVGRLGPPVNPPTIDVIRYDSTV